MTPPGLHPAFLAHPVRRVIWDWNGTLFDDAWLCVDVMNELLAEHGLPALTLARYQEVFDFPVVDYYRRLGFDFTRPSFEKLGTTFIQRYEARKTSCHLHAGARDLLRALQQRGIPQVLLSAYQQHTLDELVAHFELASFFEAVLGHPDHYASGKAERAAHWAAQTQEDPATFLFIGDTVHDAAVAQEIGAQCLLVDGGNQNHQRLAASGLPLFASLQAAGQALIRPHA